MRGAASYGVVGAGVALEAAGLDSVLEAEESPLLLAVPLVEAAAPELLSLDVESVDLLSVESVEDLFEPVLFL
jgi:hypothetical protein